MFAEVKSALPVSGDGYDAEIILQIQAAALDLTTSAEIVLPGVIDITRAESGGKWVITDKSTVTDALVITAIAVWCSMRIGNPPNYDQLLRAYNSLKGQMRMSKKYTIYPGQEDDAEEPEDPDDPEDPEENAEEPAEPDDPEDPEENAEEPAEEETDG